MEAVCTKLGHETLGWRTLPTDNRSLGKSAVDTEPVVEQWFITARGSLKVEADQQVRRCRGSGCSCVAAT